ncbi:MAG: NAD(P)H-dependent glycerol-3-phosphate dehydrogenase [bacterium]
MNKRVSILGAGSWGMAVARLLNANGCQVKLWEFSRTEYEKLVAHRGIPDKLRGLVLADDIAFTHDLDEAVQTAELLVLAVPAQHVSSVMKQFSTPLKPGVAVVNLAKGIENGTLRRMSEVVHQEIGLDPELFATLSGPSHAEEVVKDIATTVVVASSSEHLAGQLQTLFSNQNFRVYTSNDLVGVELGGALKNIVAIGVGITDGLGMGDNTRGALITRGLAEVARLGISLGARAETFAGLSGIGDLITTCTSRHSRNRYVGEKIGSGLRLDQVLASMTMVAEGVETTRAARQLADRQRVEMPITQQVYEVLFEDKSPDQAADELMGRTLKAEAWR